MSSLQYRVHRAWGIRCVARWLRIWDLLWELVRLSACRDMPAVPSSVRERKNLNAFCQKRAIVLQTAVMASGFSQAFKACLRFDRAGLPDWISDRSRMAFLAFICRSRNPDTTRVITFPRSPTRLLCLGIRSSGPNVS